MKFSVPLPDANAVSTAIQDALGGRKLADLLHISVDDSETVCVEIRKMGTSKLEFKVEKQGAGVECELVKEKIALTHRMFEAEIKEKIKKVIENLGGKML